MAPWVNGVKTGHTFGAGYVLVGSGRRKGVELIAAVIGAPTDDDRFDDTLDLLDYGFSRYPRPTPIRAGQERSAAPAASSGCGRGPRDQPGRAPLDRAGEASLPTPARFSIGLRRVRDTDCGSAPVAPTAPPNRGTRKRSG